MASAFGIGIGIIAGIVGIVLLVVFWKKLPTWAVLVTVLAFFLVASVVVIIATVNIGQVKVAKGIVNEGLGIIDESEPTGMTSGKIVFANEKRSGGSVTFSSPPTLSAAVIEAQNKKIEEFNRLEPGSIVGDPVDYAIKPGQVIKIAGKAGCGLSITLESDDDAVWIQPNKQKLDGWVRHSNGNQAYWGSFAYLYVMLPDNAKGPVAFNATFTKTSALIGRNY